MNGLQAFHAARRWGWGFRIQHAKHCNRITRWPSSLNRAYRVAVGAAQ